MFRDWNFVDSQEVQPTPNTILGIAEIARLAPNAIYLIQFTNNDRHNDGENYFDFLRMFVIQSDKTAERRMFIFSAWFVRGFPGLQFS
jgi:hypothetical protein